MGILRERFRSRIEEARKLRGWSKSELARRMGVSPQYITNYTKTSTNVGLHVVTKFAEALMVDPANLINNKPLKLLTQSECFGLYYIDVTPPTKPVPSWGRR